MEFKLEDLKKELPFKWRVQTANAYKCQVVAYIDARQAADVLDSVAGGHNWQDKYDGINNKLFCSVGIKIGGEWVWKADCGSESNIEKEKGEASDAFKRACVKWGIGRFLYNMKVLEIPSTEYTNQNGKKSFQPAKTQNGKVIWDKDELTSYCNALYTGKKPPVTKTKPIAQTTPPNPEPPKGQLKQVIIGIEGLTGWKVDPKKVESEIKKIHGKLPTTIDGREICVKELTDPQMEEILKDEAPY